MFNMTHFKQRMNILTSYEYKPILLVSSNFNITLIFTFLLFDLPCVSRKYVMVVHEQEGGFAFEIMSDDSYKLLKGNCSTCGTLKGIL